MCVCFSGFVCSLHDLKGQSKQRLSSQGAMLAGSAGSLAQRRQLATLTLAHSSCSVMLWWLPEFDVAPEVSRNSAPDPPVHSRCVKWRTGLREKPKCHFWGFQQAFLGTRRHFKGCRFLGEEFWTGHPCLRSPDIIYSVSSWRPGCIPWNCEISFSLLICKS